MQRAVHLLRGGQIAGLQRLSQLAEQLADGIFLIFLATAAVVMMVMMTTLYRVGCDVLLDGAVVLLRSRKIAGLEILRQLGEGLRDGTLAPR